MVQYIHQRTYALSAKGGIYIKASLQIKNGIYQVVMYLNGKYRWRSTSIKAARGNKRKAEERMKEILAEYESNPCMFNKTPLTDYISAWLKNAKNQVDIITYESYEQYVTKHIIPYFKKLRLNLQDVRLSDIEGYYNTKAISGRLDGREGGLSYNSIKKHSVVLNHIFTDAVRNNLIKDNPCKYAKIPRTAAKSEKKVEFYSAEQCRELLKLIEGTILYDMIYLTVVYGLRRSELMGLKWDAIDFDNNTLHVCHTVVVNNTVVEKDTTKNTSSNRFYPLLPTVKEILLKRRDEQKQYKEFFGTAYCENDYVFTKEDGNTYHPNYPSKKLQKILKRYGLEHIRWHGLRHSCASAMILEGCDMKEVSDWLGHADIGTTMNIYSHISMEHKREIGNTLDSLMQGS